MALIDCPECGHKISDKAESCPNCGYNMVAHFREIEEKERLRKLAEEQNEKQKEKQRKLDEEKRLREEEIKKRMESVPIPPKHFVPAYVFIIGLGIALVFGIGNSNGWNFETMESSRLLAFFIVAAIFFVFIPSKMYYNDIERYERIKADENKYRRNEAIREIWSEEAEKGRKNINYSTAKTKAKTLRCVNCGSDNITVSFEMVASESRTKGEVRKKSAITRAGNKAGRAGMIMATGGLWALTPKKSKYKEVGKTTVTYNQEKVAICQKCGHSWRV